MDLNQMVLKSMEKISEGDLVQEKIDKVIEKTIDEIINDTFKEWSPFGKELKKHVNEALNINFEALDLPQYNFVVMNALEKHLKTVLDEHGLHKIKQTIDNILGTAEEKETISYLVKEMVTSECEDTLKDLDYDESHEVTVYWEESVGIFAHLHMDPDSNVTRYRCKYNIFLVKEDKESEYYTIKSVKIDGEDFDFEDVMSGIYGFDNLLFQAWTQGSKFKLDKYETYFRNPEYEDQ